MSILVDDVPFGVRRSSGKLAWKPHPQEIGTAAPCPVISESPKVLDSTVA